MMLELLASLLEGLGSIVATMGTNACFMFYADEPECPKSLLK